jgi:COP9 signalosome complex subunit 2
MEDGFIREYIDAVLRTIRTQVLVALIKPYTRIELSFVAAQLNISVDEVEDLLVTLILDNRIQGKIDQTQQRLELVSQSDASHGGSGNGGAILSPGNAVSESMYAGLEKWSAQIDVLLDSISTKLHRC